MGHEDMIDTVPAGIRGTPWDLVPDDAYAIAFGPFMVDSREGSDLGVKARIVPGSKGPIFVYYNGDRWHVFEVRGAPHREGQTIVVPTEHGDMTIRELRMEDAANIVPRPRAANVADLKAEVAATFQGMTWEGPLSH